MWSTPPSCFPDTNFPLFLWIPQSITVPGISKGDKTDRFFRKNKIQKSSMNCNLFKNHDGPIDLQKPHVAVVGINNSLPVGTFMPILPLGTLGTTAKNLVWTTNPNKLVTSFYPSKKKWSYLIAYLCIKILIPKKNTFLMNPLPILPQGASQRLPSDHGVSNVDAHARNEHLGRKTPWLLDPNRDPHSKLQTFGGSQTRVEKSSFLRANFPALSKAKRSN